MASRPKSPNQVSSSLGLPQETKGGQARSDSIEELDDAVNRAIDRRLSEIRLKAKYVSFGVAAVMAWLALDLAFLDAFSRKAFASAFGIKESVNEFVGSEIENYFSTHQFVAGTYASRSEQTIRKCLALVGLPFQLDTRKDTALAVVHLNLPNVNASYLITPFVNNVSLDPKTVSITSEIDEPIDLDWDLSDITNTGRIGSVSNKLVQDFWIRIEETRNQSNQPAGAPLDVSIADLNGLPVTGTSSNGDSTACSSDNSVVKIGMLVQVTGDLRMPLD